MFIVPLIYLGYKPELKKQILFTGIYGLGIIFFRRIYDIIPAPYGIHVILLIILNTVLITIIVKRINLVMALSISLSMFIIMLINDSIIVVPFMKYLDITVGSIIDNGLITYTILLLLSNFSLIVIYIIGALRHRKKYVS